MKAPTFSTKIDPSLSSRLQQDLEKQGFSFSQPPYTLFSAKKKGIVCTLYESGALIVQGKEKDEFIEFYLEPEILKEFHYSHPEAHLDLTPRIGSDEAGKGDFFGPLCIGGVYADEAGVKKLVQLGVSDSKRISDPKVLKLSKQIRDHFVCSTVRIFPSKYNTLYSRFKNLNHLLAWAHAAVIEQLVEKTGCKTVRLDQFAHDWVMLSALRQKKLDLDFKQQPRGEADPVIAAGSILARAAFLQGLEEMEKELGITLPKGANSSVVLTGKKLVEKLGASVLEKVGKMHFKTKDEILLSGEG